MKRGGRRILLKTAACGFTLSLFLLPCFSTALAKGVCQNTANPATPTPETGSAQQQADALLLERMDLDLTAEYALLEAVDQSVYENVAAMHDVFSQMAEKVNQAAQAAAEDCGKLLAKSGTAEGGALTVRGPERAFGWKEMAAIDRAYGKDAARVIAGHTTLSISRQADGSTALSVELPTAGQVFAAGTTAQYMTGIFALSYLNTVFDEAGRDKDYESYPFTSAYLRTVAHPLPDGIYWIKNGWYNARDGGDRLHTGTDITAPARVRIRSVTDGVVTQIGFLSTPGNYVVIQDPYGFEYHYYHMLKQTEQVKVGDVVKQGDWIGLVGNTGNSARPHLHLTIISPEYTYINPYDMFLAAGIGPIRAG